MGWKLKDFEFKFGDIVYDFAEDHPWISYFVLSTIFSIILISLFPEAWWFDLILSFVLGAARLLVLLILGILQDVLNFIIHPRKSAPDYFKGGVISNIITYILALVLGAIYIIYKLLKLHED